MAWPALILVLCSVPMHAGWNLLARRQRSEGVFFWYLLVWVAALGIVPAVLGEILLGPFPAKAYVCVLISGCCGGAYFYFLARGYEKSDFTVVYPVSRALPVLLVGLGDTVLGKNPSAGGWIGMCLVVAGCLITPLHRFGEFDWRKYIRWSNLWMLLTALGTVGYSLSDKTASEVVEPGPVSAARYGYSFFLVAFLFYGALWRVAPIAANGTQTIGKRASLLAGLLNFASYWLVLWAYQLASRASYIVTFRQFSIVLGVVAAFAIYKERGVAVRVTAAVLITAGLLLIGFWG